MLDKKEFEKKMAEMYPLLYKDVYGNPGRTNMRFGFDIGPGWFPIIEELSPKLENLIKPVYEKAMADPNACCYFCGKKRRWHWLFYLIFTVKYFFMNRRKAIKAYPKWRKRDKSWGNKKLNKSVWRTLYFTLFKFKWYVACKKWTPTFPRASQVKEKFATLRYYMNYFVEGMDEIIEEAEIKSSKTCETCGKPGELRNDSWLITLCDDCYNKMPKKI